MATLRQEKKSLDYRVILEPSSVVLLNLDILSAREMFQLLPQGHSIK